MNQESYTVIEGNCHKTVIMIALPYLFIFSTLKKLERKSKKKEKK